MISTKHHHNRRKTYTNIGWLAFGLIMVLAMEAISGQAGTTVTQSRELEKTPYPKIAMLWASIRGDRSLESMARHDLIMAGVGSLGLRWDGDPMGLAEHFTAESIAAAKKRIGEIRTLNPDAVIIGDLLFYEYPDSWLPEDHLWWLRKDGERQQFWPGTHRMDWYNEDYRRHVVRQTIALTDVGIDGVFYDNLRNEPQPWVAFLTAVREAVGDEFLILANAGYAVGKYDFAAPYLNGMMYESGWSHKRTQWDECIQQMQHTQSLLRQPRISLIERFEETRDRAGWPGDTKRGQKPPADDAARWWSLCYSLCIGDFYYLFSDNTSHRHDWYPEYDVKIGLPNQPGERINSHVWQRQYEKALVVVNLPGNEASYDVKLDKPARDSLTNKFGMSFVVPPGEGRILVPVSELRAVAGHGKVVPEGFISLFNGINLDGWTVRKSDNQDWQVIEGVIDCNPQDGQGDKNLWTTRNYGDFELLVDWRIKDSPYINRAAKIILPDGTYKKDESGKDVLIEIPNTDSGIFLRGQHKSQVNIWCWPIGSGEVWGYRTDPAFPSAVHAGVTPKVNADRPIGQWNTFHIVMKGDRLTVMLNGKLVLDNAQLPGVPAQGPIALQHHGDRKDGEWGASFLQFRNIFIKELGLPSSQ